MERHRRISPILSFLLLRFFSRSALLPFEWRTRQFCSPNAKFSFLIRLGCLRQFQGNRALLFLPRFVTPYIDVLRGLQLLSPLATCVPPPPQVDFLTRRIAFPFFFSAGGDSLPSIVQLVARPHNFRGRFSLDDFPCDASNETPPADRSGVGLGLGCYR